MMLCSKCAILLVSDLLTVVKNFFPPLCFQDYISRVWQRQLSKLSEMVRSKDQPEKLFLKSRNLLKDLHSIY